MAHGQTIRRLASDIPDKLYFRIGEVARICEVPAYVLRFWESEFTPLRPNKGGTGQRLYRQRDVETALRIKRLLYDEGYTIPGARQILKSEGKLAGGKHPQAKPPEPLLPLGTPLDASARQHLEHLRSELGSLLTLLNTDTATAPLRTRPARSTRGRSHAAARVEIMPSRPGATLFDPPDLNLPGMPEDRSSPQRNPSPDPESKDT